MSNTQFRPFFSQQPICLGLHQDYLVESSLSNLLSGTRCFTCFPSLPANHSSSQSSNYHQPPVRIGPPMGPFEGCVPGWRAATGLALVITGVGLAIYSIRRSKGWLLVCGWLLIWAGILIALTSHYPCTNQPASYYRPVFPHDELHRTTSHCDVSRGTTRGYLAVVVRNTIL